MDEQLEQRIDSIVEDDVRRGFVVKDVPAEVLAVLQADHSIDDKIPVFSRVRFSKQTPRKRRLVNETVAKRYHADLKNPEILSDAKLRSLNIERGVNDAEGMLVLDSLMQVGPRVRAVLNRIRAMGKKEP